MGICTVDMKYYQIPQIAGVMKDLHARAIPEQRCQDALNVMFEEGHVKTRWGYRTIAANLPLSGPITNIVEFEKIVSGEKFLIVCTTRDIYYWDMNNGIYVPLTEVISGEVSGIDVTTADGLVVTVFYAGTSGPFDLSTLTKVGTYFLTLSQYGITAHDNLVSHVESDDELVIDADYVWSVFKFVAEGAYGNYSLIAFPETVPLITAARYLLAANGLSAVGIYEASILFYGDPLATGVNEYTGFMVVNSAFDACCVCTDVDQVDFTGDVSETERTISGVTGEIPIGGLIRLTTAEIGTAEYDDIHVFAVVTAYDEDTGVVTYDPLLSSYAVDRLYNQCVAACGGATAVSFNIAHVVESVDLPSGYMASVAIIGWYQDVSADMLYELRLCDSGDMDDPHDTAIIYDTVEEDKILAITNGIQPVRVWTGAGEVKRLGERSFVGHTHSNTTLDNCSGDDFQGVRKGQALFGTGIGAGAVVSDIDHTAATITMSVAASETATDVDVTATSYPNLAKYIDYFGSVGYEHVILANTTDGSVHNAQTIEMSDAGEIDLWNSIFFDLIDTNDPIVGVKRLGTRLIIYKERSITEAYPNPSGGNIDPFDFNQNKVNVGTPSIRTVVDMGDFHIFFGWDNVYAFNGIGVTAIGFDVMNDLNAGVNRPLMNRSFAFAIPQKNLYCLFVPYGFGVENCNRAYIYNYVEKHWTIWQLGHEMTCFGTFHQSEAPTWDDWLVPVTISGTTTNGSAAVTMANVTGIEVGDVVEAAAGIPADTNILAIDGTTVTLTNNATASGSRTLSFYKSWDNMLMRWEDLILYEDNERWVLGDVDGYIYEISDREYDDAGTDIGAYFITRDFPLNDPKQNFKLLQAVIGICNRTAGSFTIQASVDFGNTWTEAIEVDVILGSDYIENIVNWIERGRQVRFKIMNVTGSFFRIESLNIGFADAGITTIQGA